MINLIVWLNNNPYVTFNRFQYQREHKSRYNGRNRVIRKSRLMRYPRFLPLLFSTLLIASQTQAEEPQDSTAESLDSVELYELVYDQTADCRKKKDQSMCVNYFAPDGNLTQLRDNGDRKTGRWFLDDADRLCILWEGKYKPLCFVVTKNPDGTYKMVKKGKHKSTILGTADGNRDKL